MGLLEKLAKENVNLVFVSDTSGEINRNVCYNIFHILYNFAMGQSGALNQFTA